MRAVCTLINEGNHHEALVRLWVLATRRALPDDDLPLNEWERRPHARSRRAANVRALLTRIRDEALIAEDDVDDPLALVLALDEWAGRLDLRARPFFGRPYTVDGDRYFLVPIPLARANAVPIVGQANNPQSWFRWHRVVPAALSPDLRVEVVASRDVTDERLRELKTQNTLTVLVHHFDDDAVPTPAAADKFFFTGLSNEGARLDGIRQAIARTGADQADLVVLPELTVTPSHRDEGRRLLASARGHRPCLVVLGSFHEDRNGDRVNACELLRGDGRTLFRHEKLRPFGAADGAAEDIRAASLLRLLVTPIGTFAVAICKDFCDEDSPIDFTRLPVDWWLVPSMGDDRTIRAHEQRAQRLWKVLTGAVTVVANQEPAGPEKLPGFVLDAKVPRNAAVGGGVFTVKIDRNVARREQF